MNAAQKTAQRILDLLVDPHFILDMQTFSSLEDDMPTLYNSTSEAPCGTTFCLAGALAHQDGYPEEYRVEIGFTSFRYLDYSLDLLGVRNGGSRLWNFLFDDRWDNNFDNAVLRAKYVLKYGKAPESWFYDDLTNTNKQSELYAFIEDSLK